MPRGWTPISARRCALAAFVAASLAAGAVPALAAFPQDPPNDPEYDPPAACVDEKQYYLFDFLPPCAPAARDPEGAAGMSVNRAWRDFTTGSPQTTIAYVEGGINWHSDDAPELANKVYLNARELPAPTTPAAGDAACGPGVLCAADYSDAPDANGNGLVDPEDLIKRYSDRRDDDGNGYTDDISGWDFYHGQNDPATYDSAYTHANGQMKQAASQTNNGIEMAGICPRCRVLPVKAGAEALDRTDELAEAWLFAVDSGASAVVSVTADLGYSSFARQAAESVAHRGSILVQASNDFDSMDHQGGMFWPHSVPGNGVVSDRQGTGEGTRGTRTYRERSSITSWGTHNLFSVPTRNGTTSTSTPTIGAALALVMSYSRDAAAAGRISRPLTGLEAVQVLRATASDVNDPTLAWPNRPGWDRQFGYGRPNVWKAMRAVQAGNVPPVATIESPDWYEVADPTRQARVGVTGRFERPRDGPLRWELQLGLGGEPGSYRTVSRGTAPSGGSRALGSIDLSQVPRSFWARAYELSKRKELETADRYAVTLRLRARDRGGRLGEDRRSIYVRHDSSTAPGYPKRIGPGGESQPALADLQGRGRLASVFGDSDGRVHAIDSRTGQELPGWPVTAAATRVERSHPGIAPGHEPIASNVAVADLDGNGRLSVIASSTTGRVYAWGPDGRRRSGFPRAIATGEVTPAIPRPALKRTRLPKQGAFAAPVVGDLTGDGRPEIVQGGWDGRLHAFQGDGREAPGWPRKVTVPGSMPPAPGQTRVNDHKLQASPALADLNGDRRMEVVVRSQYTDITPAGGIQPAAAGYLHAYRGDGSVVPGWPVRMPGVAEAYGTAQEFITEGSAAPVAADVDRDGNDEVAANPIFTPTYLFEGNGTLRTTYGAAPAGAGSALAAVLARLPGAGAEGAPLTQPLIDALLGAAGGDPTGDAVVGFTTSGAFGRFAGGLSYLQPGSGAASIAAALSLPGSGTPINNFERAFEALGGAVRPGFPAELQGLYFLGAPIVADVTGDGAAEVVDGGDTNAVHGFASGGAQANGFPKFTPGWVLWAPSAADLDGDGRTEIVTMTREGYLYVWRTPGRASANGEWWRWHHDERSTGRYGTDTRPPGVVRSPQVTGDGRSLNVVLPGDDWYTGGSERLLLTWTLEGGRRAVQTIARPGVAGERKNLAIPRGARSLRIQAVDEAGNRGTPLTLQVAPPPPGDELILGTAGNDTIRCGSGNDRVDGGGGNDRIDCGSGDDEVRGGPGDDVLLGRSGRDLLLGGPGDDRIDGHSGDDRIDGGPGRDRASGGPGRNTITGVE